MSAPYTKNIDNTYSCHICGAKSADESSMIKHMDTHFGGEKKSTMLKQIEALTDDALILLKWIVENEIFRRDI
jgi:hypothetical protein